jgi:hypothetical protein
MSGSLTRAVIDCDSIANKVIGSQTTPTTVQKPRTAKGTWDELEAREGLLKYEAHWLEGPQEAKVDVREHGLRPPERLHAGTQRLDAGPRASSAQNWAHFRDSV